MQAVQMKINHTNTYRKDLDWLHSNDEPQTSREVRNVAPTVLHTVQQSNSPTHFHSVPKFLA